MIRNFAVCLGILLLLACPLRMAGQFVSPHYEDGRLFVKLDEETGRNLGNWNGEENWPGFKAFAGLRPLFSRMKVNSFRQAFRLPHKELASIYLLRFQAPADSVYSFIEQLELVAGVRYAEQVPLYRVDHTPDDLEPIQWFLPKIEAEKAWDICRGNDTVVVAIVDDAVRLDHEDLNPVIWQNTDEIAGDSIDNDNNGYIDDVWGWDSADEDNDPNPPANVNNAEFTHGTHVAGIASAATNNGKGVASIGYNVRIMAIKTKADTSFGDNRLDNTFGGLEYAIANKADVINMSYGSLGFSQSVQSLITVGHFEGIVWVSASGNNGQQTQRFPGGYRYVIMAGSTKPDDRKSEFSNYHQNVDVMAPGSGIWAPLAGAPDSYGYQSGTSMSTPLTAGLCALILSIRPDMDPDSVELCLKAGCENIDSLNQPYVGFMGAGRINAWRTLQCVPARTVPVAGFTSSGDSACGGWVQFEDITTGFPNAWEWDFGDGQGSTDASPRHRYSSAGSYTVRLIVSNAAGRDTFFLQQNVIVLPEPVINAGLDRQIQTGDTIQLRATGGIRYSWSPASNLSCTNCDRPLASPTSSTWYVVTGWNGDNCPAQDSIHIMVTTGVGIAQGLPGVEVLPVYPNPASGSRIQLRASLEQPEVLTVSLVDLQGREIETLFSGRVLPGQFSHNAELPAGLSKGLYLIRWQLGKHSLSQKWMRY